MLIMPQLGPEHFGSLKYLLLEYFDFFFFSQSFSVLVCTAGQIPEYTIVLASPSL